MRSDDGPQDTDDQLSGGEPPPGRPLWLIWTIVGGFAVLVAAAGIIGILAVTNRGTPDAATSEQQQEQEHDEAAAALDQLRSHLPEDLRFAKECEEDAPLADAMATMECVWADADVPRLAAYSLFDEGTAMLKAALDLVPGSDHGSSCRSASDFDGDGGQMIWQRDDRDRGTVWCFLNEDSEAVLVWTDTTPKILAMTIAPEQSDAGDLLEWFATVGQASLTAEPLPTPPPWQVPTTQESSPTPDRTTPVTTPPTTPPTTSAPPPSDPPPSN